MGALKFSAATRENFGAQPFGEGGMLVVGSYDTAQARRGLARHDSSLEKKLGVKA